MIVGFKRRFVPFVEDGSKTHTIRALRKGERQVQVGDRLDCYVNPRQKTMRLLGRFDCVRVEPIMIYECGDGRFSVIVAGNELTPDEKDLLAWRDGFRSYSQDFTGAFVEMIRFWVREHGDRRAIDVLRINFPQGEPIALAHGKSKPLAFEGVIIHWKFEPSSIPLGKEAKRRGRVVRGAAA